MLVYLSSSKAIYPSFLLPKGRGMAGEQPSYLTVSFPLADVGRVGSGGP